MSPDTTVPEAFADLREALVNLDDALADEAPVPIAVEQLGTAIDAAVFALAAPVLLDADDIAEHNRRVTEVNAAIDRFNRITESLNAAGSTCQFCGTEIENGADSVPTAVIPEEGIQMYAHSACHAEVSAASAEGASR